MIVFTLALFLAIPDPQLLEQNKNFWESHLQSPSVDMRKNALLKLRDLRLPDSLLKIQPLLNDPQAEIRYEVIRSISKINSPETVEMLKTALEREKDPYLLSELRRGIRSIEDALKAAEAEAQKAADKAAGRTTGKKSNVKQPKKR